MIAFIIALSIATSIFIVTSTIVIIRRKQKEKQNVGFVISQAGPPTDVISGIPPQYPPPGVALDAQYPATAYPQPGIIVAQHQNSPGYPQYPPAYSYPASPAACQVSVQTTVTQCDEPNVPSPPAMQQRVQEQEPSPGGAISVLPRNDEKRGNQLTPTGAVESVSQI